MRSYFSIYCLLILITEKALKKIPVKFQAVIGQISSFSLLFFKCAFMLSRSTHSWITDTSILTGLQISGFSQFIKKAGSLIFIIILWKAVSLYRHMYTTIKFWTVPEHRHKTKRIIENIMTLWHGRIPQWLLSFCVDLIACLNTTQ